MKISISKLKLYLILPIFIFLFGCEKGQWVEMSEETTLATLKSRFVVLDEMKNIEGEYYKDSSFGFPQHERFKFNLSDEMIPEDWLDILVAECFIKRDRDYEKISEHYYIHRVGFGTAQDYRIKYLSKTQKYQLEYQLYD